MLLSLRQWWQLWRVDVDRVLTAVGLIQFDQSGFLWPFTVNLGFQEKHTFIIDLPLSSSSSLLAQHKSISAKCCLEAHSCLITYEPWDQIRGSRRTDATNELFYIRNMARVAIYLKGYCRGTGLILWILQDSINPACSDLDKTDAMLLWGHETIKLCSAGSSAWTELPHFPQLSLICCMEESI